MLNLFFLPFFSFFPLFPFFFPLRAPLLHWPKPWTGSFKLKGVFSRCCVHGRMCPQKKIPAHFTMDIGLSQFTGTFLARTQAWNPNVPVNVPAKFITYTKSVHWYYFNLSKSKFSGHFNAVYMLWESLIVIMIERWNGTQV